MNEREALPAPAGTSPFHVRGTIYRGFSGWLESLAPGFYRQSVDSLSDPRLRAFFDEPFGRFGWYDVFPLLPLTHAAADLQGMTFLEFARLRSRLQALEDIQGVLKLFLKVASPALVAMRLPRLAGHYFDFGTDHAERVAPQLVRIRRTGLPRYLVEWFATTSGAFIETTLESTGAKSPRAVQTEVTEREPIQGIDMVDIALEISWEK